MIMIIIIWYYETHCMETPYCNFLELKFNNIWPFLAMEKKKTTLSCFNKYNDFKP